ncbi:hypothetical protein OE699_16155 [Sedimentimonas flavescens]|uniref:Uncharacterized protein n=1 Tax=Sedimentimonas flavescens TaxID=2851012 RepID=A0ABT3A311_9RHOB|nr:hypothetical protein [Sedimentimonas flavescens]MCV2880366.1 hypothetical protein [Sedimentimonas flavescens]
MRKDKQQRHEELCALIKETVAECPKEFEGHTWAIRPQADWCELLGVSDRTLRDLTKIPPICTTTTHVEGRKAVLLRLGTPEAKTDRHIANIMANIFAEKTGRRPAGRSYGMLRGLAQNWPEGAQLAIFRCVLNEWSMFMAGVQLEIGRMIQEGEGGEHRRYKFPSISVMLRFHHIALEMYVMQLQEAGTLPPASVIALDPKLWWPLTPKGQEASKALGA